MFRRILSIAAIVSVALALPACNNQQASEETKPVNPASGPSQPMSTGTANPGGGGAGSGGQ